MSKKSLSLLSILPFMFAGLMYYSLNQSLESYKDSSHFYPDSNRIAAGCQDFNAAKNNRSCDEYLNWRKTIVSDFRLVIGVALVIGFVQLLLPLITLQAGQPILDGMTTVFTVLVCGAAALFFVIAFFDFIINFLFSNGEFGLTGFVKVYIKS
jgi:hypothetical protein